MNSLSVYLLLGQTSYSCKDCISMSLALLPCQLNEATEQSHNSSDTEGWALSRIVWAVKYLQQ